MQNVFFLWTACLRCRTACSLAALSGLKEQMSFILQMTEALKGNVRPSPT